MDRETKLMFPKLSVCPQNQTFLISKFNPKQMKSIEKCSYGSFVFDNMMFLFVEQKEQKCRSFRKVELTKNELIEDAMYREL